MVLWTALVGIGFDILVSRLDAVDPGAARTAQVGGALTLLAVWLLVRVRALRSAIAVVLLFSILVGASFIAAGRSARGSTCGGPTTAPPGCWRAGGNPYTDLDLTLEPGSDEGRLRQYFYPPVTLAWYSIWTILLDDPRWGSLLAWLVILIIGSVASLRSPHPELGLAIVAFVAVQPGWFFLLTGSFTEPLIAMFVTIAMATMVKRPRLAAVMLGVGLASKQHLLLALPAVFLRWWRSSRMHAVLVGATAVTLSLWGASSGRRHTFQRFCLAPTLASPNADSVNLYALGTVFGLDFAWPQWIAVLAATLVGLFLSTRRRSSSWPADHIALVLATFLFLIPFSIWSHWMIVTMMLSISAFVECVAVPRPLRRNCG